MSSSDSEISRLQRADALGLAFVRTVIVLNSGAILSLITFAGNAKADRLISFSFESINFALVSFLIGVTCVLVGLIISYSYTANAPANSWHIFWDKHIIWANCLLGVVSVIAFVIGVISLILGSSTHL